MSYTAILKQRVLEAEEEAKLFRSMVDAFFSGDVPDNALPEHFILAKYGRKRHEDIRKAGALLAGFPQNVI